MSDNVVDNNEITNVVDLFPTPLFSFDVPKSEEFRKEVIEYILKDEEQNKTNSEAFSLKGRNGYHSPATLTYLSEDWSKTLEAIIHQSCTQYLKILSGNPNHHPLNENNCRTVCWAMVMREGDYSSVHTHPNSDLSGVFYLQIPENLPENEGNLVFIDPRGGARGSRLLGSQEKRQAPVEGHGWIFPSWLDHYVQSHFTGGTRISLSWNVSLLNT